MQIPFPTESDEPGFRRNIPLIFNLVYCSQAADGVGTEAIEQVIAASHRNNPRHGITGMLVFGGGIFFQLLEGPKANILNLMNKLHSDARHSQIVVLSQSEEHEERLFPNWDMELVKAEHIHGVLSDALSQATDQRNADSLRAMLTMVDQQWGGQLQ